MGKEEPTDSLNSQWAAMAVQNFKSCLVHSFFIEKHFARRSNGFIAKQWIYSATSVF